MAREGQDFLTLEFSREKNKKSKEYMAYWKDNLEIITNWLLVKKGKQEQIY